MKIRLSSLAYSAVASAVLLLSASLPVRAHDGHDHAAKQSYALTGKVTSTEEGAMEGVVVTAKLSGESSTIKISVVTAADGSYHFPSQKLAPGEYSLDIRAVGYELQSPTTVRIASGKAATADLALRKTSDLAAQLSNTEWLASFPGSAKEKDSVHGCAHCHTLERIARSKYDVEGFMKVIERMSKYAPLATAYSPQKTPAPRIGGAPSIPKELEERRRLATYLAGVNLSTAPAWSYELQTLPRLKGKSTQVVYTEYDLPKTRQPHDVIVDSTGMVWYASFGEQILGRLDPRTGKVTEFPVPVLKPGAPTGILSLRFDEDENLWLGMQFQGGVAKFDRKTGKFQTWSLPPDLNGPHVQINQVSASRDKVDGKVWLQDAGTYNILRLDLASGKFENFEPYKIPRPNVYDVIPDSKNNGFFTVMGSEEVGRIDAKTGAIEIFKTPTPQSAPRRGMMDPQDRLWFAENRADKIGMFDTRSRTFQEWSTPTPGVWPYDATSDKNGEVWAGGEFINRILRLNPKTGKFVEYPLPRATNVRRVFVDNHTTPVTFWVGSNHSASIIKLEPLE